MSRSRNMAAAPSWKIAPSREVQILLSLQSRVLEVRCIVFDVGGSGRQEIRLVLADDHAVVRAGLRALLDKRSEEHTSELQSQSNLVCRLLLEKKKNMSTGRTPQPQLRDTGRRTTSGALAR